MADSWRDKFLEEQLGKDESIRQIGGQVELIRLYDVYDGPGQRWQIGASLDYVPTQRVINNIKYLVKEVARFMLSRAPEITIQPAGDDEQNKGKCAALEAYVRRVLNESGWSGKLSKAGRDQFIAGRVALKITCARDAPLRVGFRPILEAWAQHDPEDVSRLIKLIYLYQSVVAENTEEQRFWYQIYELGPRGEAYVTERVVDGRGSTIEDRANNLRLPIPYIPSRIIINDGLTGDTKGESEVKELEEMALAYSRTTSDDQDALRFNMFPQRAIFDASPESLKNLVVAPMAMIDIQSEPSGRDKQAKAQVLEPGFSYSERAERFLNRLDQDMRKMVGVPPKSLDEYKSDGLSGKALRALYWSLITKCDEKWTEWDAALVWMVRCIYDLAVAYGQGADFAGAEFTVGIEHLYPIADDEEEERALDLREVQAGARSVRSYLDKWRPADDSEAEIQQIVAEKRMLEEQYGGI